MKAKLEFVWFQDEFIPICKTGGGGQALAEFLMGDMQTSIASIGHLITEMDDVSKGRAKAGYMGTGNSFSFHMIDNMVYLEDEYDGESKVLISYEQFLHVLNGYKHFIEADYDDPDAIPPSIDFEYIAEGDEAYDRYEATGGSLGIDLDDCSDD